MSVMDGTVNLGPVGTVKKTYVAGGLAAAGGIALFAYWRQRAAGAPDGTPTGEAALYADTRTGSELPTDAYTNPAPDALDQSHSPTGAPRTDQEWAARALEKLTWYEPGYVSSITGKYLTRQPLTAQEAGVVRELWAQIGYPPSGNIPIVPVTTTATPVPAQQPKPAAKPPAPVAMKAVGGLRVTRTGKSYVKLDWQPLSGVRGYVIWRDGRRIDTQVYSSHTDAGLKAGSRYRYQVRGLYASGSPEKLGPPSAIVTAYTKK